MEEADNNDYNGVYTFPAPLFGVFFVPFKKI